ncbi:phosphonopyruvate decarboxylase [Acetobacteraceae bacterium AT-5844]|nr:phosphonopyruvate decarboxylase [Acetobacteraceae bacterium AT-5844]
MITADSFIAEAGAAGFDFYTGVPCSYLTPLINGVLSAPSLAYVGAASEGEAVAIASGAWLAGRQTVVMCQNSGLGNAVNPLTSLNAPFRIPTLFITTWRGEPGRPDEPQHDVMGRITQPLLTLIGLEQEPFPASPDQLAPALGRAVAHMSASALPYAFVMRQGDVAETSLSAPTPSLPSLGTRADYTAGAGRADERPGRAAALERLLEIVPPEAAIIATTGKCGRELFTLADRPQHLYQVGSMGGASGMALGVALNTQKPVVVLDGDGAALMKLGTFATIGAQAPPRLVHVVLDNGVHDSTGGQPTVSASVDFAAVALACGYRYAAAADTLEGFAKAFGEALGQGPALIHLRIAPGSMARLGRPTIRPEDVARRFRDFLLGPM